MATATDLTEAASDLSLSPDNSYYYEIVDGHEVEKPHMGAEADLIIVTLIRMIEAQAFGKLGLWFSGHCGYQIFRDNPKLVRFPDISFIRSGRLPGNKPPRGYVEVVPDLVVEVVSPNDKAENVEQRLTDFLKAGVPLAWMIYPLTKQVYVFHQGPASLRLGEGDVLDGEDVLPGFACVLNDLFAAI
jgi:Uma2 family endonuclease